MGHLVLAALSLGLLLSAAACGPSASVEIPAQAPKKASAEEPESRITFPNLQRSMTGDLPEMVERRVIRALVSPSRTNFFLHEGGARGFESELLLGYEEFLNRKRGNEPLGIHVVFVPVPFGQLLSDLKAGRGDIAAAGITNTPERSVDVTFTDPYLPRVSEVVVTAKKVRRLDSLYDLAGREVVVTRGSSYFESLNRLNREIRARGGEPIEIEEAEASLETEDLLEMVNAGTLELTVADRHIARIWSQVLPDLVVREDLVVASSRDIAWAVRPGSEELLASLNTYLAQRKKGTLVGNILFERYYRDSAALGDPLAAETTLRLLELAPYFQKYGAEYDIDWLLIAALAYQESRFDQRLRSRAGAVGVMQLRPSTAADRNIGIPDVSSAEDNIHAGVRYLAFLRDRYFSELGPAEQLRFSLAAYNAGPRRVMQLRRQAEEQGLDADVWFRNVEHAAASRVGRETTSYVSTINKYYVAYKMSLDLLKQRGIDLPPELQGSN